ncbi:hypothetical protein ABPG72_010785 [Tetrahymena utriculariae]
MNHIAHWKSKHRAYKNTNFTTLICMKSQLEIKPLVIRIKNGVKSLRLKTEGQMPRKKAYQEQNVDCDQYNRALKTEPSEKSFESVEKFKLSVCVRVRPKTNQELLDKRNYLAQKLQVWDERTIQINSNQEQQIQMKHKRSLSQANQKSNIEQPTQAFEFDRVYEESATNENIFQESVSPFLDYLMQGYNSTIFAYGASGSGKTFTMQGDRNSDGITQLICKKLFERIQEVKDYKHFKVKFSYIEIYNEQIRDLIQQGYSSNTKKQTSNLELREDPVKGTILANVTEVQIANCEEIQSLIDFGNKNRTVDATSLNSLSSRSHAIVQIHIQYKDTNQGINESTQFSTLTLVDLAGSEKSGVSSNQQETQKINQSLLVLGYCINQLSKENKNGHVPYRNSKLTRMLKNSLGGNCKTLMIATISISNSSYEDTMNSLLYASHAKRIKNVLIKNEVTSSQHVANYAQLVEDLQRQNNYLKKLVEETKDDQNSEQSNQILNESVFTKEEAQKLKFEIQKHFEQETECYKDISYISDRINLIEQENQQIISQHQQQDQIMSLKNLQSNDSSYKQLLKDYNSNVKVASLKQNKQVSISKLEKLSLNRINLLQQIKEYTGEHRIQLLKVFDQKAKSFQGMIDRHNQYQQKINNQDEEINCLLKELCLKDSIIQSQNNLISVSNLESSQIKYTNSNINNYQEYEAILEESKPFIALIAKQETKQAAAQNNLEKDKNIFLPTLNNYKQNNKVQNTLAQIVQGKSRRSQSQCDPYNQPQRISNTFAVQKQLPQIMKKSCNSALSGDTQQIADAILNECSKSKFQKVMSKISVDTTIPTETNDITKSTQNPNTSSITICRNNHFQNNSEMIQSNANKSDTQYLIKYSNIQQSFNSKKYNQLSPKPAQGELDSQRLQTNSKTGIKQPQKLLQNVLQSSKFKNQNPQNSKIKQPYFSKLLVDYSGYMYNDLSQLSNNDISLNNKKLQQNVSSLDEISSPTQRVKTNFSARNCSQNKLEQFSSSQSIEINKKLNKKIFISKEKYSNSNRNNSTFKRKHNSSTKRQSANLQNISYLF